MSQCPQCELRFSSIGEVRDHLVREHRVDPDTLADPTPSLARDAGPRAVPRTRHDAEDHEPVP